MTSTHTSDDVVVKRRGFSSWWLALLMAVFIAFAAASAGLWMWYQSFLPKDEAQLEQLERVKDLLDYPRQLDAVRQQMDDNRMLAKPTPQPPSLWVELDGFRAENDTMRNANAQSRATAATASNPREPECLDPTRRRC